MSYIEFKNVCKEYKMGEITIKALDNTNFSIEKGELVVVVGPSGAGKTTALNILGGMDTVTSGDVIVDGKNVAKLKNKQLIKYRREDIGFVFQFYNLVQNLTAIENVELAVIEGTPSSTGVDPEITTGDIFEGCTLHEMPLYRVKMDGLEISSISEMFTTLINLENHSLSKLYSATLSTNWSGSSAPYTQNVTLTGILSDDSPIVDVVLDTNSETALNQLEAWGCVSKIATGTNQITVTCLEDKPTAAIPIQIKVVR